MRAEEIKKELGEVVWKHFLGWMSGQTVSAYPDGEIDFYFHDFEDYRRQLKRKLGDPLKNFEVYD